MQRYTKPYIIIYNIVIQALFLNTLLFLSDINKIIFRDF